MKELESEIENLPPRRPSVHLDDRVYSQKPPHKSEQWGFWTPKKAAWGVAWGLSLLLIGFVLGRCSSPNMAPRENTPPTRLAVAITLSPNQNPFDATLPEKSAGFQDWVVTTLEKETER